MGGKRWLQVAIGGAALCCAVSVAPAVGSRQMSPDSPILAQAEGERPAVGDVLKPGQYHLILNPGRYGLGPEPQGSRYAIAAGLLVRIDARSGKILSILREQREILD